MNHPAPSFALDERLQTSTEHVIDLDLSRVLLRDDSRFFWTILVPRRAGAVELSDLSAAERGLLTEEIVRVGEVLRIATPCEKLNVGAIGNIVSQLHVHVVARRSDDAAWPRTVWESGAAVPYGREQMADRLSQLRTALAPQGDVQTIYMPLLDEGTDVWIPVLAQRLGTDHFVVLSSKPEDQHWKFPSGSFVVTTPGQLVSGSQSLVVSGLWGGSATFG